MFNNCKNATGEIAWHPVAISFKKFLQMPFFLLKLTFIFLAASGRKITLGSSMKILYTANDWLCDAQLRNLRHGSLFVEEDNSVTVSYDRFVKMAKTQRHWEF